MNWNSNEAVNTHENQNSCHCDWPWGSLGSVTGTILPNECLVRLTEPPTRESAAQAGPALGFKV
jgi:hypothetical protein